VLKQVTRMLRKRPARSAWGLDLTSSGLKAVKLVLDRDGKRVVVTDFDVVEHRKTLAEALNDDEAKTLLGESINTFCSRNNVKADRLCLGIPGRFQLTRRLRMPRLEPAKMKDAVAYEARRHIPVPLEELAWDYHMMDSTNGEAAQGDHEILLTAVKRFQLVDRLSRLEAAKLHVVVVQSDCLALYNFLAYDYFTDCPADQERPPEEQRAVGVLDIGSDHTNLVVASPHSVWFRSSGLGGDHFTKALVREFQLTTGRAEELKRDPSKARSPSRMYKALEPVFEKLASEIRSLLDAHGRSYTEQHVERIVGCGGSFQLHGMLRYLRTGRC
jgi:type IV pilus assembly protein PilM